MSLEQFAAGVAKEVREYDRSDLGKPPKRVIEQRFNDHKIEKTDYELGILVGMKMVSWDSGVILEAHLDDYES